MDELDIGAAIKQYKDLYPSMANNELAKLCYKVFLQTEDGKVLISMLYDQYINRPCSNLFDLSPTYDAMEVVAHVAQRDFVQRLLALGQEYSKSFKPSPEKHIEEIMND